MKYPWLQASIPAVIVLGLSVASPGVTAQTSSKSSTSLVPWTFREDFRHGIPGWMSYPLAQDVGYDPLFTQRKLRVFHVWSAM